MSFTPTLPPRGLQRGIVPAVITDRASIPRCVFTSFNPAVDQAETLPVPKRLASGAQPSGTGGQTVTTTKQRVSNETASQRNNSAKAAAKAIGPEQAKSEEKLVREHLPLVQYVVSEVAHRVPNHVSRSDLVSAGMLGLAQAARSFDPERGIAFDRFASTRIRGALLDELRGRDWASRSVRSRARGLQATQEELTNRLGRAPKPDEVARTLGVAPETVHKLVDDVHRATVLNYDSLVVEGDAESFIASTDAGPEDQLLDRERKAYLMDAVGALPERLRRVVIG